MSKNPYNAAKFVMTNSALRQAKSDVDHTTSEQAEMALDFEIENRVLVNDVLATYFASQRIGSLFQGLSQEDYDFLKQTPIVLDELVDYWIGEYINHYYRLLREKMEVVNDGSARA
jgi:hypothetical protein